MNKPIKMNFSVVIVVYNEAHLLDHCLKSLGFCEELVVVDLGSTDGSVEIAKQFGAKILYHERLPNPNRARQYGISQAKNEWVFTLDPDEVFPTEEAYKIEEVLSAQPDLAAIRVPIQYYFKKKKLNCTIWAKPGITRWTVLHRDRAKGTPYAHQEFSRDQNVYHFSWSDFKPIAHYWRKSYREVFQKMWPYIKIEGEAQYAAGKRFSIPQMLKMTAIALKANLIDYRGFYGGTPGILLSLSYTWYIFMCWLSLWKYERHLTLQQPKICTN